MSVSRSTTRYVTIVITGDLWRVSCHLWGGRIIARSLNGEQMVQFCDAVGIPAREGKHWPKSVASNLACPCQPWQSLPQKRERTKDNGQKNRFH